MRGGSFFDKIKLKHLSVRLDYYTYTALKEVAKLIGTDNISEVVRMAIWYMLILSSPKLTVRKAFKEEALKVIEGGKDVSLNDALKPFSELIEMVT